MNKKIYFFLIYFFVCFIFCGVNITLAEDLVPRTAQEELYKKADVLKEDSEYDAAYDIFKKLIDENPSNNKYQLGYVDILLEQSRVMKEANNPLWATKAKEAGSKIKSLYFINTRNADYYLVWAKYSWIIEARRQSNITKALEKAFYFKPNYLNAYILKGDIYFNLAKNASSSEQQFADNTALTGRSSTNTRHSLAMTAKSAYESALSSTEIDSKKKVYVYYKMGDLEDQILGDKEKAKINWEKALSLSPESTFGRLAKERLGQ